jgi:hypothetical protein
MDLGLIQPQIAANLGADQASVWLWENNGATPELKWMPIIIGFLRYDPRPMPKESGNAWYLTAKRGVGGSDDLQRNWLSTQPHFDGGNSEKKVHGEPISKA